LNHLNIEKKRLKVKHKEINKENIKIIRIIQQGNSNSSNFNLTKGERNKRIK